MSKKAMKLALEALETERDNYQDWDKEDGAPEYIYEAITALRNALAEQPAQQEPVAWRWSESNGQRWFDWTTDWSHHDKAKSMGVPIEYAYTSPQPAQRKPLTPDLEADTGYSRDERAAFTAGWEAAEAAHGIKENT